MRTIRPSSSLANVRYEIRGDLARRAHEMERLGYEIIPLNIGNPGLFGFRTPETMRLAMIENLKSSEAYCHQKGVFPAREAVVMQQQSRGVRGVTAEEVFMGNGVSELIDLVLRALLSTDDEVLVPSPDYPLWTAAVNLNHGRAIHYPCRPENNFEPDPRDIEALVTSRTRAIVVINPNNPTGAVYSRATLEAIAQIAERHHLVVFSDEIYDQVLYGDAEFVPMATLVNGTLCCTLAGLSKVYRACGYRVGWAVFSGELEGARDYLAAMDKLSSLRLCSNVPGQWAVQTALGGYQSINDLVAPSGRLCRQRELAYQLLTQIPGVSAVKPKAALYMFPKLDAKLYPIADDQQFAYDLLAQEKVLIVQGTGFNWAQPDHFRVVFLPNTDDLADAFGRVARFLDHYRKRHSH